MFKTVRAYANAMRDPALMNQPRWWLMMEYQAQAMMSIAAKWSYVLAHAL